jgi:hypothetical protein
VAFLLGCRTGAKVSRYEQFSRQPNTRTVFAYEVIFRVPASDLFPGVYQKVEKATRVRARLLARKLADAKPHRMAARKLAILESLAAGQTNSQHARS